jgi:uncharacterized damage-inducible protein DinB
MSLGQLAMHVASIPGNLSGLVQVDEFDASQANFTPPSPSSVEEILTAHDGSLRAAQDYLGGVDEQTARESWPLTFKGKEVFTAPRGGVIRSLMLNHWYHHRGQLVVYLRQLDVPIPSVYGPSADENPFAAV